MSRTDKDNEYEDDLYADPDEDEQYFEDEEEDETRGGRGPILFIVLLVAILAEAAIVWFAYELGFSAGERSRAPIVAAADLSGKTQPAEPGGLTQPESSPATSIVTGSPTTTTENIAPPPEEPTALTPDTTTTAMTGDGSTGTTSGTATPGSTDTLTGGTSLTGAANTPGTDDGLATVPMPSESLLSTVDSGTANGSAGNDTKTSTIDRIVNAETSTATAATTPPQPAATQPATTQPAPTSQPTVGPSLTPDTSTPTPATAPAAGATGDFVIQVAAFPEMAEANRAWDTMSTRLADLLGDHQSDIQAADLGDRGTWYRLRIGYFNTKAAADDLCARLQDRGQNCMVRRR